MVRLVCDYCDDPFYGGLEDVDMCYECEALLCPNCDKEKDADGNKICDDCAEEDEE